MLGGALLVQHFRKVIGQSGSRTFDPEIALLKMQALKKQKLSKALAPRYSSPSVKTGSNLNAQRQEQLSRLTHNRTTRRKNPSNCGTRTAVLIFFLSMFLFPNVYHEQCYFYNQVRNKCVFSTTSSISCTPTPLLKQEGHSTIYLAQELENPAHHLVL